MTKEQLEEIKNSRYSILEVDSDLKRDWEWLINRVQELEKFKRDVEQMYRYTHLNAKKSVEEKENLQKQNKRYREAISYVMGAKSSHYDNDLDHALDDIKFIINETLKGRD